MNHIKPYLLQVLKELALYGGMNQLVEISSQELAQQLDTSQQTASRYLLELDAHNLIIRQFGVKKQLIQITETGIEVLKHEYSQYQQIFEMMHKIQLHGHIVSGLGEGTYYTEQPGYVSQFQENLGFHPYPGTLNVEIEYIERNKLRILRQSKGILIEEYKTKNRTFGGVICFHAEINGVKAAIVLPSRTHHSTILEFISPYYLREKLQVTDGEEVQSTIFLQP